MKKQFSYLFTFLLISISCNFLLTFEAIDRKYRDKLRNDLNKITEIKRFVVISVKEKGIEFKVSIEFVNTQLKTVDDKDFLKNIINEITEVQDYQILEITKENINSKATVLLRYGEKFSLTDKFINKTKNKPLYISLFIYGLYQLVNSKSKQIAFFRALKQLFLAKNIYGNANDTTLFRALGYFALLSNINIKIFKKIVEGKVVSELDLEI